MSFYDDDDDFDSGGNNNPLRKVVKDLEKKLAAEQKARQEAEDKLSTVSKTVKQRTVADVLKDSGANPGLARYVLADVEDPTPESVSQWLTENGELFGYKPPAPEGSDAVAQALGLPADTVLPPDIVAAYEKFAASQQGGSPSAGGDALAAKLNDPNLSHADLLNLIASASN